ncbi:TetR/AcrR family transcriptional regulator [Ferrimonas futtsuensis]|uniref:TetR/AcrR family transcriptional regulator n=1 Tax=Ferrimonas futtsuensis TaxID=364764 RepID=UPI000487C7BE|nr:TetR/AcrR family transcriptional regulator [Ferrimonas futtsuensis]
MRKVKDKKIAIAKAALKIVKDIGYQSLTMNGLSIESKIPSGTLYRYFSSKEEILIYSFNLITDVTLNAVKEFNKIELTEKERIICRNCFPYFIRLYRPDKSSVDMVAANGGIFAKACPNLVNSLKSTYEKATKFRKLNFYKLLSLGIIKASPKQIDETIKMLLTLSRGSVYVVNSPFFEKKEYEMETLIRMYEVTLDQIVWQDKHNSVDPKRINVAMKTVLDRTSSILL